MMPSAIVATMPRVSATMPFVLSVVSSIEFQAKIATARTARPRPQAVAMPSLFMLRPFVSPLRAERRCSLRLPRQAAEEFVAGAAISSRRSRSAFGGADGDAGELLVDLDD